jgi:4-alpha-glucanotransferase
MPDDALGVPPDYFSSHGQAWGFPVLDPDKIRHADGTLAEGGQMLLCLFRKLFQENPDGVRIDHIIGLIDPWVYPKSTGPQIKQGGRRLYSSPEHPPLARYACISEADLNLDEPPDSAFRVTSITSTQLHCYASVVRIILDAAQLQGLDTEALICEDLGILTTPAREVMAHYGLSGMKITQFADPWDSAHTYREANIPAHDWLMVGSHDNEPLSAWITRITEEGLREAHARYLTDMLLPAHVQETERTSFYHALITDTGAFSEAKLAALFASPSRHIQVFFADLFGIRERYNLPGTTGSKNWTLRLPSHFEALYQQNIRNRSAFNLPHVLAMALRSRGLDRTHPTLLQTLLSEAVC